MGEPVYYKGFEITALARKVGPTSKWVSEVVIKNPDGNIYPKVEDYDQSFESYEKALSAGVQLAQELIDKK